MNKLVAAMEFSHTGKFKHVLKHVELSSKLSMIPVSTSMAHIADEYQLALTLRTRFNVDRNLGEIGREVALRRTRAQMTWFMFEEFKPPLMRLREALLNFDFEEAHTVLDEIEKQMFEV